MPLQLSIEEQIRLLKDIFPGVIDPDADAAQGAAEVIRGVIERQGKEFIAAIIPLVAGLVEAVKKINA